MVIVVRLVSATRRPTVHWAHHDRGSAAWPGRALQRDSSGWVSGQLHRCRPGPGGQLAPF